LTNGPSYLIDQVLIDYSDFGADFANARAARAVLQFRQNASSTASLLLAANTK
jgi:hypothetical protein